MQVSTLERMLSEASSESDFPMQVKTNSQLDESVDLIQNPGSATLREHPLRALDEDEEEFMQ